MMPERDVIPVTYHRPDVDRSAWFDPTNGLLFYYNSRGNLVPVPEHPLKKAVREARERSNGHTD